MSRIECRSIHTSSATQLNENGASSGALARLGRISTASPVQTFDRAA